MIFGLATKFRAGLMGPRHVVTLAALSDGVSGKVSKTGDIMTGGLELPASTATVVPLKIPHGANPTASTPGDLWTTTASISVNINGTVRTVYHNGNLTVPTQAEAEAGSATTVRGWTSQRVRQAIAAFAAPIAHLHAIADITGLSAVLNTLTSGPASSVADHVVLFDGTTGKALKSSGINFNTIVQGPVTSVNDRVAVFDGTTGKIKQYGQTMAQALATITYGTLGVIPETSLPGRISALQTAADLPTNCNDVMSSGWTYIGGSVTNRPPGSKVGMMLTLFQVANNGTQIFYERQDNTEAYRRVCNNGTWTPWIKIATQTDIDQKASLVDPAFPNDISVGTAITVGGGNNNNSRIYFKNTVGTIIGEMGAGSGSGNSSVLGITALSGGSFYFNAYAKFNNSIDVTSGIAVGSLQNSTKISINSYGDGWGFGLVCTTSQSAATAILFRNSSGGTVGSITQGTGVTYNTASDYRLKTDVEAMVSFEIDANQFQELSNNLLKIMSLQPCTYRWVGGEENADLSYGLIAHEAQRVMPEIVSGEKDAEFGYGYATIPAYTEDTFQDVTDDETGKTTRVPISIDHPEKVIEDILDYEAPAGSIFTETDTRINPQQVDYSKLTIPLLAAVQDLTLMVLDQQKEIDALKTQIETLRG